MQNLKLVAKEGKSTRSTTLSVIAYFSRVPHKNVNGSVLVRSTLQFDGHLAKGIKGPMFDGILDKGDEGEGGEKCAGFKG